MEFQTEAALQEYKLLCEHAREASSTLSVHLERSHLTQYTKSQVLCLDVTMTAFMEALQLCWINEINFLDKKAATSPCQVIEIEGYEIVIGKPSTISKTPK